MNKTVSRTYHVLERFTSRPSGYQVVEVRAIRVGCDMVSQPFQFQISAVCTH
jgi:hypothetical protein